MDERVRTGHAPGTQCGRRSETIVLAAGLCLLLSGCGATPPVKPALTRFYPPLPQQPRIQFLRTLTSSDDVSSKPTGLETFIVGDDPKDRTKHLKRPYGMAFLEGRLYVCDIGARTTVVIDLPGKDWRLIGAKGGHQFGRPVNVSLGPGGEKYVADITQGHVLVVDAADKPVRMITLPEGMKPCDAVWQQNELFVADLQSNTIKVFDPKTGTLLRTIGKQGSGPGAFFQPTNLAFGPQGNLYVSDLLNARVQKLNREGRLLRIIGKRGAQLGGMVRPKGIAVDRAGRLYVADAATDSVQIFSEEGELLLMLGGPGFGPGDMSLPAKVVISYQGIEYFAEHASPDFRIEYLIFVSNHDGPNKVNVYGFGTYRSPLPSAEALPREQAGAGEEAAPPDRNE